MASIFFCVGAIFRPHICQFGRHSAVAACASGGSAERILGNPSSGNRQRKRCQRLVRAEGLEPPQLSSLEPKSSASTSSATPADSIMSGRDAAGGALITWAAQSAAKKWPSLTLSRLAHRRWTYPAENGPHLPDGRPD